MENLVFNLIDLSALVCSISAISYQYEAERTFTIGHFRNITQPIVKCLDTNYFIYLLQIIVFQYPECKLHILHVVMFVLSSNN